MTPVLTVPVQRGAGPPDGIEVTDFVPVADNGGWATGVVLPKDSITGVPQAALILRYSGGRWTQVGDALPSTGLRQLVMVSATDGWALGADDAGDGVLLHVSNGTWRRVALPAAIGQGTPAFLRMRSTDEGWLSVFNPKDAKGMTSTTLLHFVRGTWSVVTTPLLTVDDLAPLGPDEAYAVGPLVGGGSGVVHLQGTASTIALRVTGGLMRLAVFAGTDAWATGSATSEETGRYPLVFYHYDGRAWSAVDPRLPAGVQGAEVVAPGDIWAYSYARRPATAVTPIASVTPSQWPTATVIDALYHTQAGAWQPLPLPYADLSIDFRVLRASIGTAGYDVWALGYYSVYRETAQGTDSASWAGMDHSVLLHYTNGQWTEYGR